MCRRMWVGERSGVLEGILLIAAAQSAASGPSDSAGGPPSEIIVTGERVKRSLKETPSSVYVATKADIVSQSVDRVEQVLALVPNVQLGNGSEGPAIRGLDTTGA